MITVRIFGGLGNQLFQYAFGKQKAISNNDQLYLDNKHFEQNSFRNFGLNKFKINAKYFHENNSKKYYYNTRFNAFINYIMLNFNVHYETKVKPFNLNHFSAKKGYFDGYWQSYKYFDDIKETLRNEIVLKKIDSKIQSLSTKINQSNSVSVHIRKSDYTSTKNSKIYADCSPNFYINCMNYFMKKYSSVFFYVFSDDFDWVKKNIDLKKYPNKFIDNSQEEDLVLMSSCKHNIISNSTFSWWAAYLNKNTKKEVICPMNWFNPTFIEKFDIYPENWIIFKN